MDDDLRARVERLEAEVETLRQRLDATWQPVASNPEPKTAKPSPVQRAWGDGDLETKIGGKWLAVAGITLLVIAVVFFFQLAVERGWIGLAMQVVLGVVFGLGIWAGGIVMQQRQTLTGFAQVLSAGGVAIAAFALFVGHHFPEYQEATGLSLLVDSLLLGLLGIGAALDAGLRRAPVQAATAAGLIVWTAIAGLDATIFSLAYTVAMVAALLAVGLWRGWPWMAATAAPAAALVWIVHLIGTTNETAVLACIVLVHVLIVGAATRLRDIDTATVVGHITSWVTLAWLGLLALSEITDADVLGWWLLGVAALGFGASFLVVPRPLRLAAAIPATVAAIAAPLLFEPDWPRIPMWLAMFAAGEALWRLKHWTTSLSARPILLAVILLHAMSIELGHIELRESTWITDMVVLILAGAAGIVAWQGQRDAQKSDMLVPALGLAFGTLVLLALGVAAFEGPLASVSWAVLGIGYVVAGFMVDRMPLRIAGLAVFAATLVRIVTVDLAGVDALIRVLAFMGIAAILLVASWLYVRRTKA